MAQTSWERHLFLSVIASCRVMPRTVGTIFEPRSAKGPRVVVAKSFAKHRPQRSDANNSRFALRFSPLKNTCEIKRTAQWQECRPFTAFAAGLPNRLESPPLVLYGEGRMESMRGKSWIFLCEHGSTLVVIKSIQSRQRRKFFFCAKK